MSLPGLVRLRQLYTAYARPASQQWDDDLLFACCHTGCWPTTGSRGIDFFAAEAAAEPGIAWVLKQLIRGAQQRWGRGRFDRCDPPGGTYLYHLVLLRIPCSDGPIDLDYLCPDGTQTTDWWPALVGMWRAVLLASDLAAVTAPAGLTDESPTRLRHASHRGTTEPQLDLLAGDQPTALNRAAGSAFLGDALIPTTVPIASLPKLAQWLESHATASRITAGALRTACNELRDQTPAPLVGPVLATAARATPALAYDDGFLDQVGVSSAGRTAAALSACAAQWALPGLAAMLADDRP